MQGVEVDGALWGHLVECLPMLPHDGLTDSLFQANGRSPHQGQTTQIDQTTVCQNVCLLRHLGNMIQRILFQSNLFVFYKIVFASEVFVLNSLLGIWWNIQVVMYMNLG